MVGLGSVASGRAPFAVHDPRYLVVVVSLSPLAAAQNLAAVFFRPFLASCASFETPPGRAERVALGSLDQMASWEHGSEVKLRAEQDTARPASF